MQLGRRIILNNMKSAVKATEIEYIYSTVVRNDTDAYSKTPDSGGTIICPGISVNPITTWEAKTYIATYNASSCKYQHIWFSYPETSTASDFSVTSNGDGYTGWDALYSDRKVWVSSGGRAWWCSSSSTVPPSTTPIIVRTYFATTSSSPVCYYSSNEGSSFTQLTMGSDRTSAIGSDSYGISILGKYQNYNGTTPKRFSSPSGTRFYYLKLYYPGTQSGSTIGGTLVHHLVAAKNNKNIYGVLDKITNIFYPGDEYILGSE